MKQNLHLRIKQLILKESITCVQCSTEYTPPLFVSLTSHLEASAPPLSAHKDQQYRSDTEFAYNGKCFPNISANSP